jgi:Uma2 family endonuclease
MALVYQDQHYTYSDYATWDDNSRYELIEGTPYMLSSPSQAHQTISMALARQFANFLMGKSGKIFAAPFDVRLNPHSADDIVVQPDLLVVCDMAKLDGKACVGAPDMIIEILSPSTARHDRLIKYRLYQNAGIREYWIVDVETKTVQVWILKNGEYTMQAYDDTDTISVSVLEGCLISLVEVFSE